MRFGQLVTTGRAGWRCKRGRWRERTLEVVCPHGIKKFISTHNLKTKNTQSCLQWEECFLPKVGTRFGKLVTTGKTGWRRKPSGVYDRTLEVVCSHGVKKFVPMSYLKIDTRGCRQWEECSVPKVGTKFGTLIATGKFSWARKTNGTERLLEVVCPHGIKKFIRMGWLKGKNTKSCRNWFECGLTRSQFNHYQYLRRRTPRVSLPLLQKHQGGICPLCGDARRGAFDSREHFIPIIRAARWKISLRRKHEIVNHRFNIFAAHHSCNSSRGGLLLHEYWDRNPQFRWGGRQAFSNLMAHHRPSGNKDMKIITRLLREAGMLLKRD